MQNVEIRDDIVKNRLPIDASMHHKLKNKNINKYSPSMSTNVTSAISKLVAEPITSNNDSMSLLEHASTLSNNTNNQSYNTNIDKDKLSSDTQIIQNHTMDDVVKASNGTTDALTTSSIV